MYLKYLILGTFKVQTIVPHKMEINSQIFGYFGILRYFWAARFGAPVLDCPFWTARPFWTACFGPTIY